MGVWTLFKGQFLPEVAIDIRLLKIGYRDLAAGDIKRSCRHIVIWPHEISLILEVEMKSTFNKLVAAPFGRASVAPRGTVWSGSAACRLYISRVSHRSSSVIRSCIPIARFPHVQVFIDSLMFLLVCVVLCCEFVVVG